MLSENQLEEGVSSSLTKKLEHYLASHDEGKVPPGLYDRILDEVDRVVFSVTLKYTEGNQTQASRILGINRNTLRKKMQRLHVENFDK